VFLDPALLTSAYLKASRRLFILSECTDFTVVTKVFDDIDK